MLFTRQKGKVNKEMVQKRKAIRDGICIIVDRGIRIHSMKSEEGLTDRRLKGKKIEKCWED